MAVDDSILSATLAMPGGGVPYVLRGSAAFGAQIQAGLALEGVLPGTPEFEAFFFAAQAIVDVVDPLAFGDDLVASGLPLHLIEVAGGGPGGGLPDQTIPNAVDGAPLAGTEGLIGELDLLDVFSTTMDAMGVRGVVRFQEGTHGSLIDPGESAAEQAAFLEMQTQVAVFAATAGTEIRVTDGTVIVAP